jgi:DUF4097 and DUF4098 domain-containing protein YvlB
MKRTYVKTLALGLGLGVAALASAQTPINEKRPAAPDAAVEIENLAGSIAVVGWTRGELEVTGTLGRGVEKVEVTGNEKSLRVRVVYPEHGHDTEGTTLKVQLPSGCRLDVSAVSATIDVRGLTGRVELESVSGDVTVAGRPAGLEASSVSGSVEVEAAPTGAKLEAVSGSIKVGTSSGTLEAKSVSGDVTVAGGSLERAGLSTTSGNVRCAADLAGTGPIELESMSGEVVLEVPAKVVADFELSTFSGDISSKLGPAPERTSEHAPGKELEFSTGPGGPRVKASSFSGSVELRTR